MTNASTVADAVTQLTKHYKRWIISAGATGSAMPQNTFREGSDRNYSLKNTRSGGCPSGRAVATRLKSASGVSRGKDWSGEVPQ